MQIRSPFIPRVASANCESDRIRCAVLRRHVGSLFILVSLMMTVPVRAGESPIFSDDFENGAVEELPPGWSGHAIVANDPASTGSSNKTMRTKSEASSTVDTRTNVLTFEHSGIELSFRFWVGEAGTGWIVRAFLMGRPTRTAQFYTPGYGLRLTINSVQFFRTEGEGTPQNQGELSKVNEPEPLSEEVKLDGWNTVVLRWEEGGKLTAFLNGREVATSEDTNDPIPMEFSAVKISTYRTKSLQDVYYDDIIVRAVSGAAPATAVNIVR